MESAPDATASASAPSDASAPTAADGTPHALQRFTMRTLRRSEIKNADYNPRVISDQARKKLKAGLESLGLLQPLVWNEKTGNLVGGHQRLSILDDLLGKGKKKVDYTLDVAAVQLTVAQEHEANILLNNPEAMGQWDVAKLDEALRTEGVRIEATGFDMADIYNVLGESPFALEHGEELQQLANAQRATTDALDAVTGQLRSKRDDSNFYIVVVFKDVDDSEKFMTTLGLEINTFQDGRRLHALLEPLYKAKQAEEERLAAEGRARIEAELAAIGKDALVQKTALERDEDIEFGADADEPENDEAPVSTDEDAAAHEEARELAGRDDTEQSASSVTE